MTSSETSPVTVSILVVSYNTREHTRACLQSIARETVGLSYEVIVVDNASSDGSADMIESEFPALRLIRLDENVGFAAANNLAAAEARGTFVLLLNPDTVLLDRAINRVVEFARCCPDAGIWGGRTVFGDGRLNPASCWGRMTLWNLACRTFGLTALAPGSEIFNGEAYGSWDRSDVRAVDIVAGCFLLIERVRWHALGGFDTRFFMYGEDADLCLRAIAQGARPMITPDATLVHHGAASEPVQTDKVVRLLTAKAELINRHFEPSARPLARFLLQLWPAGRTIACLCLAALSGRDDLKAQAASWQRVWIRRGEWRNGFSNRRGGGAKATVAKPMASVR